jgi:ribose transport system ATP-binding protein
MENALILEMDQLRKSFPGVQALKDVSISAKEGEILGLIGVNGAGKSTLMNILGGIVTPDSGEIAINGERVRIKSPAVAEKLGIAFIQQEIQLFENLTVLENIFIADLNKWRVVKNLPFLNSKKMAEEARKYLAMLGCEINVSSLVSELAVGEQQMVQIARALSQGGKILLFDEPTSSLTLNEKQNLFKLIGKLKESNVIIIYISHHLDEIFEICDRVVILRDGKVTGEGRVGNISKEEIIRFMLGHEIEQSTLANKQPHGNKVLEVRNLSGERYPKNVSFSLAKGEVLGIWGLMGSGRTELVRTTLGLDKKKSGEVLFGENGDLHPINPQALFKHIGYLTEGRHFDGLFLNMPIWQNITSVFLKKFTTSKFKLLNTKEEKQAATQSIRQVNVSAVNENVLVKKLSGGNQQKIAISKWFIKKPKILFFDEPTKGVDVGAKAEIQNLIFTMAREGVSFVIISSEIEEIMSLCERILVIHQGEIVNELCSDEISKENLMKSVIGRK